MDTRPLIAAFVIASASWLMTGCCTRCQRHSGPVIYDNTLSPPARSLNLQTVPADPTPVPAAPDSIEGQLLAQGKHWEQNDNRIEVGSYVEDILKNRLNQPSGRGWIGKVIETHERAAVVDFGRGYKVGILYRELKGVTVK